MSDKEPCRGCGEFTSCIVGGQPYHPSCFRENRIASAVAEAKNSDNDE